MKPMHEDPRMTWAADRHLPWAVRPETLAAIAETMRGELNLAALTANVPAPQAMIAGPRVAGGVAVISLRGLITPRPSLFSLIFGGGGGLAYFLQDFREALADNDVATILINIDSPGGRVDLIPEAAAEIREGRKTKSVVAIANTMAASAAYWLAAQADEIVITPSGQAGSIGVFTSHEDLSAMAARVGIATTLISAGRYKTEGNQFEPLSDDARAAIQANVDEIYGLFVDDVAAGRDVKSQAVRDGYGEGRLVTASQALAAGMVDRVDTLDDTISRLLGQPVSGTSSRSATAPGARAQLMAALTTDDLPDDELEDEPAPETEDIVEDICDPEDEVEGDHEEDVVDDPDDLAATRRRIADVLLG